MIKRILSSLVGLPLVLAILFWGSPALVLGFFAVIQCLVAWEIMRIYVEEAPGFPRQNVSLALASTLAGNLTPIGSVANLIVFGAAGAKGQPSFGRFLAVGLPVTLLSTAAGLAVLLLLRGF